jgi:DNA-binding SARP family transcriptional activator/tetratricopeptide (TPR) repeat protein
VSNHPREIETSHCTGGASPVRVSQAAAGGISRAGTVRGIGVSARTTRHASHAAEATARPRWSTTCMRDRVVDRTNVRRVDSGARLDASRGELTVRLLGSVEASVGGRPAAVTSDRLRSVLAVLALSAGESVSVDRLATAVWGEGQPADARSTVQLYVARLRGTLGPERIRTTPSGYLLDVEPDDVDALRFVRLLDAAAGSSDRATERARLAEALALWRAAPFGDLKSAWLAQVESTRLVDRYLDGMERLIDIDILGGRPDEVIAQLREFTTLYPLRERFWGQLMLALSRAGRSAEALGTYQRLYRILADEVGVEPGQAVRQLHRRILAADTDDPRSRWTEPSSPPAAAPRVPRQLPADIAAFTGRTHELADLYDIPGTTAVVITAIDGMAGIGKTALAVHAAHELAGRYPDGQLFIDLHGYTEGMAPVEPGDALHRMLRALGVPGTQIPSDVEERAALFRTRLAGQRTMIVLDNAATESQVAPLLPGAPGCLVLITSRRRLAGLDHTHTLSLGTLSTPDAVALFVHTAGADQLRDQPPELLAELVELCGWLPLAIRIAAARLRSHPAWKLSHLVERLRDQRHRLIELEAGQLSVTAALDLSYRHLPHDQQRTYRLLGLHPGPDVDALTAAALLDSTRLHGSRMLDKLLDAHLLLEPAPGRYQFHDLTRAHAAHTATGDHTEPATRAAMDRLFDYHRRAASLAMDAAYPYEWEHRPPSPAIRAPLPDLPSPAVALGWLDTELPNLLAAARYAIEHSRSEDVLALSAILHRHLRTRGRYHDAETLHHHALVVARGAGDRAGELAALACLGHIHRMQGRLQQATEKHQQALQIARAIGHQAAELDVLNGLGQVRRLQGEYEQATDHYRQALQIARAVGHRAAELDALNGLGQVRRLQGEYEQATSHYRQALQIARATGHRTGELIAQAGLGHIHRLRSRYEQATEHYSQALRIARATGHRTGELIAQAGLGHIHRRQGQHAEAAHHYQQLLDLAQESGDRNVEFEAQQGLGRLWHAAGDPDSAITHYAAALALADELGQPLDQARARDGLAHVHHALRRHGQARKGWQLALDILTSVGVDHTDDEETTVAALRARLADTA